MDSEDWGDERQERPVFAGCLRVRTGLEAEMRLIFGLRILPKNDIQAGKGLVCAIAIAGFFVFDDDGAGEIVVIRAQKKTLGVGCRATNSRQMGRNVARGPWVRVSLGHSHGPMTTPLRSRLSFH